MGFPRQEYWSGLPFPSPGDLPNPGIESMSPAWQVDSSPPSHVGSPNHYILQYSGLRNPRDRGAWWATVHSRAFLRGGNSPREAEVLAKGPRALDDTARTVAEDSQWPGLLIPASLIRHMCGKLESKICLRASLWALW